MPNKTFLRGNEVYEAPDKRLQNDIEITGATITRVNGRITAITFGGGGGASTLTSPDGAVWTQSIDNLGKTSWTKP